MNTQSGNLCPECFEDAVFDNICTRCGAKAVQARRDRRALPLWTVISGKYRVGKVLGAGGFGITYIAEDMHLGRRVALKEYFPSGLVMRSSDRIEVTFSSYDDEEPFERGLKRFLREGRHLAKFDHPNIVRVHDVLQANGTAYIAMEYLDGITLKERLDALKQLGVEEALKLIDFVLDALKAVHRAGIVHRDTKPDNIYITGSGRVLLLDFGGAKQLTGGGDRSVDAMFAHGYAAPEQYVADSDKVGEWTDVYGAGATLYRMLTGKKLPSALERSNDDPPLEWQGMVIPSHVCRAVEKAVSLKQSDRFQTIVDFAHALIPASTLPKSSATNGSSAIATESTQSNEPSLPVSRRGAAALVLGLAAIAATAGWVWFRPATPVVSEPAPPTVTQAPSPAEPVAPSPSPSLQPAVDPRAVLNDMLDYVAVGDWSKVDAAVRAVVGTAGNGHRADAGAADARSSLLRSADDDIARGAYDKAAALLQRAVVDHPRDAEVWAALGFAQIRMGRVLEAKASVTSALSLAPHNGSAWATMAEALGRETADASRASGSALQLAVYFSKNRSGMLQYLKNSQFLLPKFRSIIRSNTKALDQVPERKS